ncbi:MAG: DUF5788 family protein [Halodesulfurarchaeum sp.]
MRENERKGYLERIERDGATIGASIPRTLEIAGETVRLRDFVLEVQSLDSVPPEKRQAVTELKTDLRRERRERKRRLEHEDITTAEAEDLVDAIVGIDRALNALQSLGPTDIEGEREAQRSADQKRWLSFLDSVLGREDGSPRGGVRRQ